MEQRSFSEPVEIRRSDSGAPMIRGYFAVFNKDSRKMGGGSGFIEQVDPAALNKTIQEADVRALGNHQADWLLGRTKAGTARLGVDSHGGWYEVDINEKDPDGQRALSKIERGDWDGSSFTFISKRDEWNWDTKPAQRRLMEIGLIDVGPVTFPAYPDATVARRALEPLAERFNRPVEELVGALERGEMRSILDGERTEDRAVWSTAYVDGLPDSAFLYVANGDRKFPYKDSDGNVDLPHLRNALARIPDSGVPDGVKAELTSKAQKILAAANRSDEVEGEQRVGRKISASTRDTLTRAMTEIQNLLSEANPDEVEPDGDADDQQRAQSILDLTAEFRTVEPAGVSVAFAAMQIQARERRIATKAA